MDAGKIFTFFIAAFMIIALLLVSGCQGKDAGVGQATPFIGGKVGLAAKFVDGSPPDQIFDAGQFPFGISVQLENRGESLLPIADTEEYVEIVGLNPEDFGKKDQAELKSAILEKDNVLNAAKKNFDGTVSPGGQSIVDFSELLYKPDLKGDTDVKIRANICYNYKTQTTTKICLKEDLMETENAPAICKVSGDKRTDNSGGPIHITSFKEAPIGTKKVQFSFVISHVGDLADSFFAISEDECSDKVTNQARYVVYLDTSKTVINGKSLDCDSVEQPDTGECASKTKCNGFVRLFDKKPRSISCTLDTTNIKSTFEKAIEIDLVYKYMQSIEKNVVIKDVSTGSE